MITHWVAYIPFVLGLIHDIPQILWKRRVWEKILQHLQFFIAMTEPIQTPALACTFITLPPVTARQTAVLDGCAWSRRKATSCIFYEIIKERKTPLFAPPLVQICITNPSSRKIPYSERSTPLSSQHSTANITISSLPLVTTTMCWMLMQGAVLKTRPHGLKHCSWVLLSYSWRENKCASECSRHCVSLLRRVCV